MHGVRAVKSICVPWSEKNSNVRTSWVGYSIVLQRIYIQENRKEGISSWRLSVFVVGGNSCQGCDMKPR